MLFTLLRLIDNMVYAQHKSGREKDRIRLLKPFRANPPFQSASYIAMKSLGHLSAKIYNIMFLAVRGNGVNGKIILENDEFLSQHIHTYGVAVGQLLRESIKHSVAIRINDQ